ncbi:MAG TPA: hypothetical protein VNV60_03870 [Holophagaceae bacterium]|jgi:hypothetical protein|nr:hypothetical protein [Holophagaceae bacterium]
MPSQVVFDVNQAGYQSAWFPAFGLIFFLIGAVLAIINRTRAKRGDPAISNNSGTPAPFLPWLSMGFSLLWSLATFSSTYGDYRHLRDALNQGGCQKVDGQIEHFHPANDEGRGRQIEESFDVQGAHFSYSAAGVSAGFNQIQAHGGPLKEGLRVRIYAFQGQIARLEILP